MQQLHKTVLRDLEHEKVGARGVVENALTTAIAGRADAEDEARRLQAKAKARTRPRSSSSSSYSSSSSRNSDRPTKADGASADAEAEAGADSPRRQLFSCALRGDVDGCQSLLAADSMLDINWQRPADGNTALHVAADQGHVEVARLLLGAGAQPEATNNFMLTPFSLAAKGSTVERLLAKLTRRLGDERRGALRCSGRSLV